jgi:hypothetical protein
VLGHNAILLGIGEPKSTGLVVLFGSSVLHKMKRSNSIIALGILLVLVPVCFALDPSLDVNQYAHASWKIGEAFSKGIIRALAQTPTGLYLGWGMNFGLLRFDGVRAVRGSASGEFLQHRHQKLQAGRDVTSLDWYF